MPDPIARFAEQTESATPTKRGYRYISANAFRHPEAWIAYVQISPGLGEPVSAFMGSGRSKEEAYAGATQHAKDKIEEAITRH